VVKLLYNGGKKDKLPVMRQRDLLDLSRSGIFYTPVPLSVKDMELMRQIDEVPEWVFPCNR
jgi:putative transposase